MAPFFKGIVMSIFKAITPAGLASAVVVSSLVNLSSAAAQDAASMSCDALWHARNAIYARNGFCFKTDRARAAFGPGCFPPYGQLHGWEHDRVNELQTWEARKGC
jgi:hypothetical protein